MFCVTRASLQPGGTCFSKHVLGCNREAPCFAKHVLRRNREALVFQNIVLRCNRRGPDFHNIGGSCKTSGASGRDAFAPLSDDVARR